MDLKGYLPDAMLYKVDRASMAVGLEVRVPFLDNEVINYALRMPLDYKSTSEFQHKAPLKNLLVKLAPHYDAHQPKKGFNFPLRHWLHTHWKEVVMDLTTKRNLEDLGLPPNLFLDIVNNFYQRNANATTEVWYLFNLLLWHDKIKKFSHKA
jgi:asparagine synthase (glutamine-hydrolysing)